MIKQAIERVVGRRRPAAGPRPAGGGRTGVVAPGKMVWIFGTARTGSSWLSSMMGEMDGYSRWHEPLVGHLFGNLYYVRAGHRGGDEHFVLGDKHRDVWLRAIRDLVVDSATARFPEVARGADGYLVIKEPQGSMGAPLLMEALPESRMILLARDPRDVVASNLDAHKGGTWTADLMQKGGKEKPPTLADKNPDAFVKGQAERYARDVGNAKAAYDAHEGRKVLVKYEDLRSDALGTMRRIYSELELPAGDPRLSALVEKHAWENVPEEEKGEGKFHRKARPGGWRQDLTPKQVGIVERETADLLEQFYPARSTA